MNNFLRATSKVVNDLVFDMKKYKPEILTSIGIGGFFLAIYKAIEVTPKASKKIEKAEFVYKDEGECETEVYEPLPFKEKVKLVWKDYLPVAVLAGGSTFCIISSLAENNRRNAKLVTACKLLEEGAREYRTKVEELVSERKLDEIEQKISQERIDKSEPDIKVVNTILDKGNISKTIPGTTLFYEPLTNTYFYADINDFKTIALDAREEEANGPDGYLSVDEWLINLGIDEFMDKDVLVGWRTSGWSVADQYGSVKIEFKPTCAHIFGDAPCLAITYDKQPIPDYDIYYK